MSIKQRKLKKLTPTQILQERIKALELTNYSLKEKCNIYSAENSLYKEFFSVHFKQGVPSLVKALRQAISSLQQMTTSLKGR